MAWIYLITAGLFEIGWPVGLKWAQEPRKLIIGVVMAVVCMAISGLFDIQVAKPSLGQMLSHHCMVTRSPNH